MGESAVAEPGPATSDRRRSGPVRAAVDRMLRDLTGKRTTRLAIAELPAAQLVDALLAQRYAGIVDRASETGDDARLVAAGEKLRGVLEALHVEPAKGGGGDGSSGSNGRVRDLFSGQPAMGDAAHA